MPETALSAVVGYSVTLITAALLLGIFFVLYTRVTAFDELALIRAGKRAAALSLAGALIGFSLVVASAIVHNASFVAFVAWGVGAMAVQVGVYLVASRLMSTVKAEIEADNVAMGGFFGTLSLVAGIVNAACLS